MKVSLFHVKLLLCYVAVYKKRMTYIVVYKIFNIAKSLLWWNDKSFNHLNRPIKNFNFIFFNVSLIRGTESLVLVFRQNFLSRNCYSNCCNKLYTSWYRYHLDLLLKISTADITDLDRWKYYRGFTSHIMSCSWVLYEMLV